jgi:glycosyltransferase involved in cell wall biosynthesis
MKIAIVSSRGGGLDTYALEAGRWLAQRGHTVHLIYLGERTPPQLPEDCAALRVHVAQSGKYLYYLSRLRLPLRSIIAQYERTRAVARVAHAIRAADGLDFVEIPEGYAGAQLMGDVPFVMKIHGAEWAFRRYCEDGDYPRVIETIQGRMMMAAQQRHSVSMAYAAFIAGACRVPPRLIDVVRYPTDFAQFPQREPPPDGPPYHLTIIGRLEHRKGVHTLVAALPQVWAAEPETYVHFFGKDGSFGRPQIDAAIPPDVQRGRLIFYGFVPRQQVIDQLYRTHVYVGPTRFETSGLHLQEAISAGRPVIATRVSAIPEFIRHQETGWLVPLDDAAALADAIIHALRHPAEREAYGRAGRELARRMFDIETVMPQQLALYQRDF